MATLAARYPKRSFIPGHVWHRTHRCHKREYLLKFPRDRQRWIEWLYQVKKYSGLSVLDYMVTSNHIHLLVFDNGGRNVIPVIELLNFENYDDLKDAHYKWVDRATQTDNCDKENCISKTYFCGINHHRHSVSFLSRQHICITGQRKLEDTICVDLW